MCMLLFIVNCYIKDNKYSPVAPNFKIRAFITGIWLHTNRVFYHPHLLLGISYLVSPIQVGFYGMQSFLLQDCYFLNTTWEQKYQIQSDLVWFSSIYIFCSPHLYHLSSQEYASRIWKDSKFQYRVKEVAAWCKSCVRRFTEPWILFKYKVSRVAKEGF